MKNISIFQVSEWLCGNIVKVWCHTSDNEGFKLTINLVCIDLLAENKLLHQVAKQNVWGYLNLNQNAFAWA